MKKLFYLVPCLALTLFSCSNDTDPVVKHEANFTVDYVFSESGSLSRATGSEVYDAFYNSYIKTKKIAPKTYYLEFKAGEETVLTVNGNWDSKTGIRLLEGEYNVTGYSYPIEKYAEKPQYLPSDSVYITFNEKVNISKDMSTLVLNAKYDSFLLLFDKQNKSSVTLNVGEKALKNDDSCYWIFSKEKSWTNWDNGFSFTHYFTTNIETTNGDELELVFGKLPLEKGKFYYFNDMTNSFDLPKMENGN